jgi:5-(aminomethyl)-3-furanmethanol phosphate kinase
MPRRVIKLGGSLLSFAEVRDAFPRWRRRQSPAADILLVGGGTLVDAVRDLDERLALGDEAAHWLAIRAMGVAARLAVSLWPEFLLVADLEELNGALAAGRDALIFDAEDFLRRQEPHLPGVKLPAIWSVTSDSIAARLAEAIEAEELVLLKSTLPGRPSLSCSGAASLGLVDPFFPAAAQTVPRVRAVNLRSPNFAELQF